jgi:hypothetical protein
MFGCLQAGYGFGLALEAGTQFEAGTEMGRQYLNGDRALQTRI